MASSDRNTWCYCYGYMEQLARDNAIETNYGVFYSDRDCELMVRDTNGSYKHCVIFAEKIGEKLIYKIDWSTPMAKN